MKKHENFEKYSDFFNFLEEKKDQYSGISLEDFDHKIDLLIRGQNEA